MRKTSEEAIYVLGSVLLLLAGVILARFPHAQALPPVVAASVPAIDPNVAAANKFTSTFGIVSGTVTTGSVFPGLANGTVTNGPMVSILACEGAYGILQTEPCRTYDTIVCAPTVSGPWTPCPLSRYEGCAGERVSIGMTKASVIAACGKPNGGVLVTQNSDEVHEIWTYAAAHTDRVSFSNGLVIEQTWEGHP